MRFLLVTGQLAKDLVRRHAGRSHVEYDVIDMRAPVAALLTAKSVSEALRNISKKEYDVILTPGLIYGDVSLIEETTGVPTFKGPRYAADLPTVLDLYGQVELSKVVPACELLADELRKRALDEVSVPEKNRSLLLSRPGNLSIGSLTVGIDFPMRTLAEIVDAPLLSNQEITDRAQYYIDSGADIIDIGMIVGGGRENDADRAVRAVKATFEVPVSIDTIDPIEAKAAVGSGADLILSVDAGNVEEMSTFARDVPVVVIPTNHKEGQFPKNSKERVEMMKRNILIARRSGFTHILADLILDPIGSPGFVESIVSFHEFRRIEPELPLFCGIGNVVELLDADTMGVNALAAGVASELGISLLLTTEVSDKCRGCVKELATATKMMFLSKKRGSVPTDLGVDLLSLKDGRFLEEAYDSACEMGVNELQTCQVHQVSMDPKGCFKIMIDRKVGKIVAIHYPMHTRDRPDFFVKGETAQEIYRTLIASNLIEDLNHSAYVGYELGKAEIALRTGKSYVQDSTLFT